MTPKTTPFQNLVYQELLKIPKGETRTYLQIAQAIGHPQSARAVARACAANKNLITIPCHRVVRSDGQLGGYSGPGGALAKQKLLLKEGVKLTNGHSLSLSSRRN